MTEKPRRNHFGAQIAERMARAQGLLPDDVQCEEPEYRYPWERRTAFWKRVEEEMKMEAGD